MKQSIMVLVVMLVSSSANAQLISGGGGNSAAARAARVAAESARDAAVLARDAALAAGKVYPDTAAGLAATAEGGYFSVPSPLDTESFILYREVSGVAVEAARYPPAKVSAVADAFKTIASKNLYDPSLAEDGKLYSNPDGASGSAPNYARSGLIPVNEGNTYTLSGPTLSVRIHFWGASGASQYLGGTDAGYPVGANPVRSDTGAWTFSVPIGSGIRYVGINTISTAHSTAEFDANRKNVQLEIGTVATSVEPYGDRIELDARHLPADSSTKQQTAAMTVTKVGENFYVRVPFSAASDLVMAVDIVSSGNGITNWTHTFVAPKGTPAASLPGYASGSNLLHLTGDDATPIRANGTTVGANHGHTQFVVLTAAGHGKTNADIGSRWIDGSGVHWTLIKIADANTIWVLSDYTKAGDVYAFTLTETGSLTHVSGATNTGTVTPTARGTSQIYPSVKGVVRRVLLDGATDITAAADGVFECDFLEITNAYDVTDLSSVLDYIKAHPGVAPVFDAPEIEAGARLTMTYRFNPNGSCTVYHSLLALKDLSLLPCGFIQANALKHDIDARRLFQYIPSVTLFPAAMKTWDFAAVEEITSGVDTCVFTPEYWSDPMTPPSRMAQILRSSAGTPIVGFQLAYDTTRSGGMKETRRANVHKALEVRDFKKQYPTAIGYDNGTLPLGGFPAGSYFEVVGHRSYWDPAAQPNATLATYVEDGDGGATVYLDFHKPVSFESFALPARFRGLTITAVEKSDSLTVHNAVVGSDGVLVSVTGTYGSAVLKLGR